MKSISKRTTYQEKKNNLLQQVYRQMMIPLFIISLWSNFGKLKYFNNYRKKKLLDNQNTNLVEFNEKTDAHILQIIIIMR